MLANAVFTTNSDVCTKIQEPAQTPEIKGQNPAMGSVLRISGNFYMQSITGHFASIKSCSRKKRRLCGILIYYSTESGVRLVSDKIYTFEELRKLLAPVFKSHDIRRAVLFGSYGKGMATGKSDVDLLVDSNLHGLRFVGLIEELRGVLDKDMDVLDVTHVEPGSYVDSEIRETGVLLYEK